MKLMSREEPLLVDGGNVWMRIDYHPPHTKQDRSRGRKTVCLLLGKRAREDEEPPVLSTGVAYTHPLDRYDKLEGRKHAFKAAIEQLLPRGAVREGVWAWYRATVRQPESDRILRCPHCGKPLPLHPRRQDLAALPTGAPVSRKPAASLKAAPARPATRPPAPPAPGAAPPKGRRKTAPAARSH